MNKPRKYATPTAFRRALEDRFKQIAKGEGTDLQRLLREAAFDRLLTRLFSGEKAPWVLKGGYAMELRIKAARATKDIDLTLREVLGKREGRTLNEAIFETLREAAAQDLGDYFTFIIGEVMQDLDAAPYGGARFPVEARLDGRTFVKFHIDVGAGDVVLAPLELTEGRDWLGFAGIAQGKFPTISQEQQFAEKLHAYTLPRQTPNSRTRDLVDMLLLVHSGRIQADKLRKALRATFERRNTHPVPAALPQPPKDWAGPFARMAEACGLSQDMDAAFQEIRLFWESIGIP